MSPCPVHTSRDGTFSLMTVFLLSVLNIKGVLKKKAGQVLDNDMLLG